MTRGTRVEMRWLIPLGTLVSVCKVSEKHRPWKAHETRKPLTFEREVRTKEVFGSNGAIIFEQDGYYILTRRDKVRRVNVAR